MGLRAALVDRARVHERVPSPVKVNGRTTFTEATGAWFRARLEIETKNRSNDPSGSRERVEDRPVLIYALTDELGQAVELTSEKRIEVDSIQLGRHLYVPDADPIPYRKKRRVIAGEVALKRVESHEFEEPVR